MAGGGSWNVTPMDKGRLLYFHNCNAVRQAGKKARKRESERERERKERKEKEKEKGKGKERTEICYNMDKP